MKRGSCVCIFVHACAGLVARWSLEHAYLMGQLLCCYLLCCVLCDEDEVHYFDSKRLWCGGWVCFDFDGSWGMARARGGKEHEVGRRPRIGRPRGALIGRALVHVLIETKVPVRSFINGRQIRVVKVRYYSRDRLYSIYCLSCDMCQSVLEEQYGQTGEADQEERSMGGPGRVWLEEHHHHHHHSTHHHHHHHQFNLPADVPSHRDNTPTLTLTQSRALPDPPHPPHIRPEKHSPILNQT